jgi:hypothetical protein
MSEQSRVLVEFTNVHQRSDEPRRRWFQADNEDLIVWFGSDDRIMGFQLCYDRARHQRALAWDENAGFSHARVDDGEAMGKPRKSPPILLADGAFDAPALLLRFAAIAAGLPQDVAAFVRCKIEEYAVHGRPTES